MRLLDFSSNLRISGADPSRDSILTSSSLGMVEEHAFGPPNWRGGPTDLLRQIGGELAIAGALAILSFSSPTLAIPVLRGDQGRGAITWSLARARRRLSYAEARQLAHAGLLRAEQIRADAASELARRAAEFEVTS